MSPGMFKEGQKVWFHGLKAVVFWDEPLYAKKLREAGWGAWAVPIEIQRSGLTTIAHVNQLRPRGKKK